MPTSVPTTAAPSFAPSSDVTCPDDWEMHKDKCYNTAVPRQDYASCLAYCTNLGATLPCVMNEAENNYVSGIHFTNDGGVQFGLFLGLNDIVTEGSFEWQAGCTSTYTNYLWDEPNNYPGLGGEDCVTMMTTGTTLWNDINCNTVAFCACEKAGTIATPVSRRLRGSIAATH